MKIELSGEELGLLVYALRPHAFREDSAKLHESAEKLQKRLSAEIIKKEGVRT